MGECDRCEESVKPGNARRRRKRSSAGSCGKETSDANGAVVKDSMFTISKTEAIRGCCQTRIMGCSCVKIAMIGSTPSRASRWRGCENTIKDE